MDQGKPTNGWDVVNTLIVFGAVLASLVTVCYFGVRLVEAFI